MNIDNYVTMLHTVYDQGTNNHPEHNSNPDYWSVLLGSVIKNKELFKNKNALDFGCGKGRNVSNLLSLTDWKCVDGIDISKENINYCSEDQPKDKTNFYLNNGKDLSDIKNNKYDFVMSTIVLQHLCVYDLRLNILKEIHRVMKTDGIFSFQMGYGDLSFIGDANISNYYDNNTTAQHSNGSSDVRISDPNTIIKDLENIGFKNITYTIKNSWADGGHLYWIYLECIKI